MTEIEKAESLLPSLSRDEKVRLLERLVRDLGASFPGIASTPGVVGGEACIVRTRIPVWTLVHARQLGLSEEEILRSYPVLLPEDLLHAWAYYDVHPDEIDRQIEANEAA